MLTAFEWVVARWTDGSLSLTGWGLFLGWLIFAHVCTRGRS